MEMRAGQPTTKHKKRLRGRTTSAMARMDIRSAELNAFVGVSVASTTRLRGAARQAAMIARRDRVERWSIATPSEPDMGLGWERFQGKWRG
jgi:hypothetical protein